MPLYQALARVAEGQWPQKPVQALMESPMACGAGACFSCAVETRRGVRLVCKDGPCFEMKDLAL